MTTPQATWMPLIARQRRSLHPPQAPRIILSRLWVVVELTLADRDLAEGGGSAAGCAHNWCAACLLS